MLLRIMGGISSHPCPYAECKTITRDPARSTQIRISSRVRNLVLNSSLALKVGAIDRDSNQTLSHGIFDAPQSLLLFKFCVYLAKGALAWLWLLAEHPSLSYSAPMKDSSFADKFLRLIFLTALRLRDRKVLDHISPSTCT